MRPNEILDVLRANERTIKLAALLVGGLALLVSLMVPKVYSAETQILVSSRNAGLVAAGLDGGAPSSQPERDLSTQAEILRSTPVLAKAIKEFGLSVTPKDLQKSLEISPVAQTDILVVRATARTPEAAAKTANAVAQAYIRTSAWQDKESIRRAGNQVQTRVELLDQTIQGLRRKLKPSSVATAPGDPRFMEAVSRFSELSRKLDQVRISQETATGAGVVMSAAVADPEEYAPRPILIGLVGMLVGGLVSVAAVLLMSPVIESDAHEAGETPSAGSPN